MERLLAYRHDPASPRGRWMSLPFSRMTQKAITALLFFMFITKGPQKGARRTSRSEGLHLDSPPTAQWPYERWDGRLPAETGPTREIICPRTQMDHCLTSSLKLLCRRFAI